MIAPLPFVVNFLLVMVVSFFLTGCEFPQEWHGEWNLEGERESLDISVEDFGTKGFCLTHEDDIYVIYKRCVPRI